MTSLFTNPLYDEFAQRSLAMVAHGGASEGEIQQIAATVPEGADHDAFFMAWNDWAKKIGAIGDECNAKGRFASAADAWNRAATYARTAGWIIYGTPTDPRLAESQASETRWFEGALLIAHPRAERLTINSAAGILPGWFIPAPHGDGSPTKTLICTNGYDSTMAELLAFLGNPALQRGYNVVIYDGPGQGAALVKDGITSRPDWEVVLSAVVDSIIGRPDVDSARIASNGWSLGGYLCVRGATGEPRIAATIADPGMVCMGDLFKSQLGLNEEQLTQWPELPAEFFEPMEKGMRANEGLNWKMIQRAFWVHGVSSLAEYMKVANDYTVRPGLKNITGPVFVSIAEGDPPGAQAGELVELLGSQATGVHFTSAEGAGGHCEMGNRPLLSQISLDWLDDQLAQVGAAEE